jgi:hypothetical protein
MRYAWPLVLLAVACAERSVDDACWIDATHEPFTRTCLPVALEPELEPTSPEYGRVPCVVIVTRPAGSAFCDCTLAGYAPVSDAQAALVRDQLRASGLCEAACCEEACSCELLQFSGAELDHCQSRDGEPPSRDGPPGWCYVEPDAGFGEPSLVADCPITQRQLLRFLPSAILNGSHGSLACIQ